MTDEAAKERKKLDTEVQQTRELIAKKKKQAAQQVKVQQTLKNQNKQFYCDWCNKQYKTVGEFSNHLSSYDHHHVKRFKEMKAMEKKRRGGGKSNADKTRRREQKREEAQLRKRMAAAGVPTVTQTQTNKRKKVGTGLGQTGKHNKQMLTVEQIMQFYQKHDKSKADRDTAEYILTEYTTEEILKNLMDKYAEVPGQVQPSGEASGQYQQPPSTCTTAFLRVPIWSCLHMVCVLYLQSIHRSRQ